MNRKDSEADEDFKRTLKVIEDAQKVDMTTEELIEYYDTHCAAYDKIASSEVYNGPEIATHALIDCYEPEEIPKVKILDAGAGSGVLGPKLYEKGFGNIDALEPSRNMLVLVRGKKVYKELICDYISTHQTQILDGCYDVVMICGAFCEGHIPTDGLPEIARITKKDGYIVNIMKHFYLETVQDFKNRLVPRVKSMAEEGIWDIKRLEVVPNYGHQHDGLLFVLKKK